ncbi:unnamed protein product [Symbiodinium natans]|uniref:Aminoglycoside phosphotransferase domain-containing protein n=1 Tax=Symbiodinium natans TaxID=878477 RepID=A0A812KPX7_9DINO|nr:unnamed protein product [Symbiodinium natans]
MASEDDIKAHLQLAIPDIDTVSSIRDCSKGCDNWVYLVSYTTKADDGLERAIWRCPRNPTPPHQMHKVAFQAAVLRRLEEGGVRAPRLIYEDPGQQFLVESCLGNEDATVAIFKDATRDYVVREMAHELSRLHAALPAESGFGYMTTEKDDPFLTSSFAPTWWAFVHQEIESNTRDLVGDEGEEVRKRFRELSGSAQDHLDSVTQPVFVHSDLDGANARVHIEGTAEDEVHVQFCGLIDFADGICGDPLFDMATLWDHCALTEYFETIFQPFFRQYCVSAGISPTLAQLKVVALYGCMYAIWRSGPERTLRMLDHALDLSHDDLDRLTSEAK